MIMKRVPSINYPCCFGITLRGGVKFIAVFQIGVVVLLFIFVPYEIHYNSLPVASREWWKLTSSLKDDKKTKCPICVPGLNFLAIITEICADGCGIFWTIVTIFWIFSAISIGFHIILYIGANQKNAKMVKSYLVFFCVLLGLMGITLVYEIATKGPIVLTALNYIPLLYQGWVVYRLHKEIEEEQNETH